MGLGDHFERKFHQCDLPSVVHAFENRQHRVAIAADLTAQSISDFIKWLFDDFFGDLGSAKAETVLEECEVDALLAHAIEKFAEALAGFIAETFEFHVGIGADEQGLAGFHFAAADADLATAVHELADELKLKSCFSEGGNAAIGLMDHPAALHGVEKVVT